MIRTVVAARALLPLVRGPAVAALTTLTALAVGAAPSPLRGQLADASAAPLGQGGAAVATARGFASVATNPAGLGMSGKPGFSLAVLPLGARAGLDPVTLGDLDAFEGRLVSADTKERWLARILDEGGQEGALGVEVSLASLSAGRLGFQLSSMAGGTLRVSPGVAEAILYGNAGRTGAPADLDVSGSEVEGFAVTTAAVSYGFPVALDAGEMAVGATLSASLGHAVVRGRGSSGRIENDPVRVDVRLPLVMTSDEDAGEGGSGVGLDVGIAFRRDRLSLGAGIRNLVNTFSWDAASLVYREGTALFEQGSSETDFDERPLDQAPDELRRGMEDFGFGPTLAAGAAWDVEPDLRVMGEIRNRFGDGMGVGPAFHAGVGAEYRVAPALHLRAGAAAVTDGIQLGGGLSVVLGPVHLSVAGARRSGAARDATLGHFALSFGAH